MHVLTPIGRRLGLAGAAIALLAGGLVGAALPAQAANLSVSFAPGAVVGVPASVSVSGATNGATLGANVNFSVNFSNGNNQAFSIQVDDSGTGTGTWVPDFAGGFTALASDGTNQTTDRGSVSAVGTTTSVTAPSVAGINQAVTLQATVASTGGSTFGPTGSVQFSVQGGAKIGQPVALNGATPSVASVNWTPTALGNTAIVATYIPANNGGATCSGGSCTSSPASVNVTASGSNVGLSVPALYAGTPATITATVYQASYAGSVAFSVNGAGIGGSVPVGANGVATVSYTPSGPGNVTISASWTGNNGQSGTASQTVTVQAQGKADTIVVDPNGDPAPWSSTSPNQVVTGNYVLTTKTASGAAAKLSVTGAGCALSGNTLVISGTSGSCTLTATSPGGNGYAGTTANFALVIGAGGQTANLALPNSGRVKKGRTITLAAPGQDTTNAGQVIDWNVISGAKSCKLLYPADGSVKMKKVKKGTCVVAGSAPASNNLGPFYVQRSYSG